MALKPTKKHIPKLTVSQVLHARDLYFNDNWSLSDLADEFEVSKGAIQKAVTGIGRFYSSIEDDIPQEVKENRMSIKEIRGTLDDGKIWQEQERLRIRAEEDKRMREEMKKSKAVNGMLWKMYGDYYKDL